MSVRIKGWRPGLVLMSLGVGYRELWMKRLTMGCQGMDELSKVGEISCGGGQLCFRVMGLCFFRSEQ